MTLEPLPRLGMTLEPLLRLGMTLEPLLRLGMTLEPLLGLAGLGPHSQLRQAGALLALSQAPFCSHGTRVV